MITSCVCIRYALIHKTYNLFALLLIQDLPVNIKLSNAFTACVQYSFEYETVLLQPLSSSMACLGGSSPFLALRGGLLCLFHSKTFLETIPLVHLIPPLTPKLDDYSDE